MEKAIAPNDIFFWDAVEYASVKREYIDIYFKDAEKDRLNKELQKLQKAISAGESKLKNEKFISNAPANIVEGAKAQLAESVAKKEELEKLLARLG